jgi:hypothetical protein
LNDANEDDVVKVDPANLNGTRGGLVLKSAFAGTVNGFTVCPGGMYRFGLENAVAASTAESSLGSGLGRRLRI